MSATRIEQVPQRSIFALPAFRSVDLGLGHDSGVFVFWVLCSPQHIGVRWVPGSALRAGPTSVLAAAVLRGAPALRHKREGRKEMKALPCLHEHDKLTCFLSAALCVAMLDEMSFAEAVAILVKTDERAMQATQLAAQVLEAQFWCGAGPGQVRDPRSLLQMPKTQGR